MSDQGTEETKGKHRSVSRSWPQEGEFLLDWEHAWLPYGTAGGECRVKAWPRSAVCDGDSILKVPCGLCHLLCGPQCFSAANVCFLEVTWWPFRLQLRPELKAFFNKMFRPLSPASTELVFPPSFSLQVHTSLSIAHGAVVTCYTSGFQDSCETSHLSPLFNGVSGSQFTFYIFEKYQGRISKFTTKNVCFPPWWNSAVPSTPREGMSLLWWFGWFGFGF